MSMMREMSTITINGVTYKITDLTARGMKKITPVTGDELNKLAWEEKLVPGDFYLITEDATHDDMLTKGKIFVAKDNVNFGYLMSIGGGGSVESVEAVALDMLVSFGLAPVLLDADGAVITDGDGSVLVNN